jgi:recombination protein RecA
MTKRERKNKPDLDDQMRKHSTKKVEKFDYEGDMKLVTSTGSTLLDLAISGGRVRGGGMPSGILIEVFGPSGCGKSVLLSEIAGNVQRTGGGVVFYDPEARLNPQFAKLFGLEFKGLNYSNPDTVPQVFKGVRDWKPENDKVVNGVFADSLAALSTELEMGKDEGDKMGMRRAKEFSEELRKTCRILKQNNLLMVCSNQVRVNVDAGPYGQKYMSPGGESIGFYSSLRLRATKPEKIKAKKRVAGKEVTRIVGVRTEFEVFKSSIWKPHRSAPVTILFDYGIDDIVENLQFIKDYTNNSNYTIGDRELSNVKSKAVDIIEEEGLENELREQVIDLWERIESKFDSNRKIKRR